MAAGFLAAAVSGFAAIHFLLAFVRRRRLYPFAAYCAVLGVSGLLVSFLR
ncbi:MAG: undecaprenyl-diphosphate phosphatase [Anaerolineae bacterium]